MSSLKIWCDKLPSAEWCEIFNRDRQRLFATSWTVACQAPLSMEFFRQEYWNGLPFPSPGDLPNPGMETDLLHCRRVFTIWAIRKAHHKHEPIFIYLSLCTPPSDNWDGIGVNLIIVLRTSTWERERDLLSCDRETNRVTGDLEIFSLTLKTTKGPFPCMKNEICW